MIYFICLKFRCGISLNSASFSLILCVSCWNTRTDLGYDPIFAKYNNSHYTYIAQLTPFTYVCAMWNGNFGVFFFFSYEVRDYSTNQHREQYKLTKTSYISFPSAHSCLRLHLIRGVSKFRLNKSSKRIF